MRGHDVASRMSCYLEKSFFGSTFTGASAEVTANLKRTSELADSDEWRIKPCVVLF